MQTVNSNTAEQINSALFALNTELTNKIAALETRLQALESSAIATTSADDETTE